MEKFAKLKYSEPKITNISEFETTFTIQPLERGIGTTIGAALRRVLLSSISGVAMFAIKIKGVQHEFQTIDKVYDDVAQLILNIKKLQIKYVEKVFEPEMFGTISLKAKEGDVVASQFEVPAGLSIINPSQKITTIAKGGNLELEIFFRVGHHFISFEENKENIKSWEIKLDSHIKTGRLIATDSDFSPVSNVSYEVKSLNTKSMSEEKLTLSIKTNGTRTAKKVLTEACAILSAHINIIGNTSNLTEEIFEDKVEMDDSSKLLSLSIASLDLSVRSYNSLKRAGIEQVSDLVRMSSSDIKDIPNLGSKSLEEIMEKLEELGVKGENK